MKSVNLGRDAADEEQGTFNSIRNVLFDCIGVGDVWEWDGKVGIDARSAYAVLSRRN